MPNEVTPIIKGGGGKLVVWVQLAHKALKISIRSRYLLIQSSILPFLTISSDPLLALLVFTPIISFYCLKMILNTSLSLLWNGSKPIISGL